VLAILTAIAYTALKSPYPLTIEAVATLEPQLHKTIFTNLDGYVEELLVEDGQIVDIGTQLARVRSPELDLRIEQLLGELRTIKEKRNALQIASNQLNLDAADSIVSQNRLASEVKQLDTQEGNLNSQLSLFKAEKQKTIIISSIRGTVVAKDLKQQLASRPLRRGDALFRIVDFEGPWHLKIHVADKDSGYVLTSRRESAGQVLAATIPIRFVLDSIPGEQFDAHVNWISNSTQNTAGEGCHVEMHAEVNRSIIERAHMGASARAYFHCGEQPIWFVWCRPLVEAIQRRLWFWS
jgi:multidrug efflux pump subunit AcrA (membrane-fusion protein)